MLEDAALVLLLILITGASSFSHAEEIKQDCSKEACPVVVQVAPEIKRYLEPRKKITFSTTGKKLNPCYQQKGVYSDVCPYTK